LSEIIIPALAAIVVAIIEAFAVRDRNANKRRQERIDRHAEIRAEESRLSMKMMSASIELGLATALALVEGKLNGEMKRAREKAEKAQEEYFTFVDELAARVITK
jgi:hypothetical protein